MALILIGLAIYVLPILVFHFTINKYDNELDGMPFTAQELGQDILNDFEIKNVDIEPTEMGDHYDPDRKKIRIKKYRLNRKSLTALSIITHEIGHAIQHKEGYEPLSRRQKIIKSTTWISRLAGGIMYIGIGPIIATGLIPLIKIAGVLVALSIIINIVLHLITLDVEFDASYKRALPILKEKIPSEYHKACNTVLTAAAFTYVVGSLASFLSLRYAWPIIRKILR